jgi:two-component system LytT family response regulator
LTSPLRVVVVEDQPLARERLVTLLRQQGVQVVGECADGAQALAVIPATTPDAVFLDVQMPEINGFDVIEALGLNGMPPVVFVTAFDKYALKAFEVHAFDYLLKPFGQDRLAAVVTRLSKTLRTRRRPPTSQYQDLLNEPRIAASRERVVLRSGGRIVFVRRDDIDWVKAEGNYCRVRAGGKDHLIRETLTDLAMRLGPSFERIHRSTLINLQRVEELRTAGGGEYDVVLKDGVRLRVTRLFRPRLERRLREQE